MSTHPEIKRCLAWFDAFTREYIDQASKDILLTVQSKVAHTMRVLAHVRGILSETDVGGDVALAAEVAAILHDVARFPQLVNSATFDDKAGYNHAEEGAAILRREDVLEPFPETVRELVITAVGHHNLGVLPDAMSEGERQVLEILRDADKIDVLRTVVKYMSPDTPFGKALKSGMVWHETEVSGKVVALTRKRQLIPFELITWSNDFILFQCGWIHDLHFPYAYRQFHESGVFEDLLFNMPDKGVFKELKKQLRGDLARYIAQG